MYKVQKRFKIPMGHRLSKHSGLCKNVHGHQIVGVVGLKSRYLNENDMVIDFSDLKRIIKKYIDKFDHAMVLNSEDQYLDDFKKINEKVVVMDCEDPTAEILSEYLYNSLKEDFELREVSIDFVTIYENDDSSATYTE